MQPSPPPTLSAAQTYIPGSTLTGACLPSQADPDGTLIVVDHFTPDPRNPAHHGMDVADFARRDGLGSDDVIGKPLHLIGKAGQPLTAPTGPPGPPAYASLKDWAKDTLLTNYDRYATSLREEVANQDLTHGKVINYSNGTTLSEIRNKMMAAVHDPDHPDHEMASREFEALGANDIERENKLVAGLYNLHQKDPEVLAARQDFKSAVSEAGEAGFNLVFAPSNEGRRFFADQKAGIKTPNNFYTNVMAIEGAGQEHVLVVGEAAANQTAGVGDDRPADNTPPGPYVDVAYHGRRDLSPEEQMAYGRSFLNGTSFAAPEAASDLLKLRQAGLDNRQARTMILNSAVPPENGAAYYGALGRGVVPNELF